MTNSLLAVNTPDNRNRLIAIELSEAALKEAGGRVLGAFNRATPFDTLNAAGTFAYHEAVRVLRELFCPKGWTLYQDSGLELIQRNDGKIRLGTSSGDKYVGIDGVRQPTTKNHKGPLTGYLVAQNSKQLYLFHQITKARQKAIATAEEHTWYFLYYIDKKKEEFRSEISLPININTENMKINQWKERILLPSIAFNQSVQAESLDFAEEIDFDIKRKNNG